MKLKIKMKEINYGDVAVKAMPLLAQTAQHHTGAVGEVIAAFSALPSELIHDVFNAIPEEKKNGIVALLSMEYREKVLNIINSLSEENRIGVTLDDFTVNRELEIEAEISGIDYLSIVNSFLPVIRKKLLEMGGMTVILRPVIEHAPAERLVGLLDRFVGDNKNAFMASLINRNQHILTSSIENIAGSQNIHLEIESIFVEI